MRRPLRVGVISNHALVTAGLGHLVAQGPDHPVTDGVEAALKADGLDVVIYDLDRTTHDEDTTELDHLASTQYAVVALAVHGRADLSVLARRLGACVVIDMGVSAAELVGILDHIAAGRLRDEDDYRAAVRKGLRDENGLSERELDVLELIATGALNQQIAAKMFVTNNTIKTYVRTTYRKIKVTTRAEAVLWAVQNDVAPGSTTIQLTSESQRRAARSHGAIREQVGEPRVNRWRHSPEVRGR